MGTLVKLRRYYSVEAGWRSPQLQVQITPLSWGLAYGHSPRHIGVQIGPIAVAVKYRLCSFLAQAESRSYPGDKP